MRLAVCSSVRRIETRICLWQRDDCLVCDGFAVSLLRENVLQHVEHGKPSGRFPNLHALANVSRLGSPVRLNAKSFRDELSLAWEGVWRVPRARVVQAAASSRRILPAGNTLGELTANLIHELSSLSARTRDGDPLLAATPQMLDDWSLLRAARAVSLGPSRPLSP
jgi:hypothetical protein